MVKRRAKRRLMSSWKLESFRMRETSFGLGRGEGAEYSSEEENSGLLTGGR